MNKEKQAPVFDCCVCCGTETNEERTKNIYERSYYVEGSGQLCKECWVEVYPD